MTEAKPNEEFREMLRIGDKDVPGRMGIFRALFQVKGIGFVMSNAVCNVLNLDKFRQVGTLTSEELSKIEDCVRDPAKYNIPSWLHNRRKDPETEQAGHIISSDLDLRKKFDIRSMKILKSYKGIRHQRGLPVRGQKTRSSFRKGKTLGVQRSKGKKK